MTTPECECPWMPEHMWTRHYGAIEPGSTQEYNPECPVHGEAQAASVPLLVRTTGVRSSATEYDAKISPESFDRWHAAEIAAAKAEALRDAAVDMSIMIPDLLGYKVEAVAVEDLLVRADQIEFDHE